MLFQDLLRILFVQNDKMEMKKQRLSNNIRSRFSTLSSVIHSWFHQSQAFFYIEMVSVVDWKPKCA